MIISIQSNITWSVVGSTSTWSGDLILHEVSMAMLLAVASCPSRNITYLATLIPMTYLVEELCPSFRHWNDSCVYVGYNVNLSLGVVGLAYHTVSKFNEHSSDQCTLLTVVVYFMIYGLSISYLYCGYGCSLPHFKVWSQQLSRT